VGASRGIRYIAEETCCASSATSTELIVTKCCKLRDLWLLTHFTYYEYYSIFYAIAGTAHTCHIYSILILLTTTA